MHSVLAFLFGILACAIAASETLPPPKAITDPQQITSKPDARVEKNLSIEKLYTTRQIGGASWSPDGRTVAFISNLSGHNNIWLVPSEGGWPTQLTVSDQRQTDITWSPDGKWIAYASDYDGDEQWDIFLVSPKTGQVVNLTSTREIAEETPAWSPDGRFLAYAVKPKTSSVFEIDIYDTVLRVVKHVTTGTPIDRFNFGQFWSPDGRFIFFTQRQAKGTDSNIFMADIESGAGILLTPHAGEKNFEADDVSPDGKTVLITSNANDGYDNVGLLDIASKKIHWLTTGKGRTSGDSFSPDGKALIYTANSDGDVDICLHELGSSKDQALPLPRGLNSPSGNVSPFTRDGKLMLYLHTGATSPGDLWVYNFADGKSRQLTYSLVGGVHPQDMVEPYLVHYPSKDGRWTISAFVYVPYNLPRNGQHPAIVYVHGGPNDQAVDTFDRFIQFAVNQGYLVIAPNYRGSTGYGKEFQQANLFDMGGGDLQDVLAAAEFIKHTGYVNPKKVILMGSSYGGYLTMMGVTKAPDVWAAGVSVVPFVNWFTELRDNDPAIRQWDLASMGDPVKNKALYQERSPINFVDQIKAPLYLLAGGNDPRCPKTEALQVVNAIRKRGGVVEFKVYDDEGHGIARVQNQIDAYKRIVDFLKGHVPPADCGCSLNE
jgi:dipeptidyl aminopeptidase/acylaminoacyl peptidase